MPIYAYRCETCGYQKDILRKLSDPVLTLCPECGRDTFRKQVTAAGFQLKGSGWYVTDFRDNGKGGSKPATDNAAKPAGEAGNAGDSAAAPTKSTDSSPAANGAAAPAASASTPAAAPAASSSTGGTATST
jgi:putative FmdB family regulatory protein